MCARGIRAGTRVRYLSLSLRVYTLVIKAAAARIGRPRRCGKVRTETDNNWPGGGEGGESGPRPPIRHYKVIMRRGGTRALFSAEKFFLGNADPRRSRSPTRRSSIMSYDRASRLRRQSRPRIERPPPNASPRLLLLPHAADVNYKLPRLSRLLASETISSSAYIVPRTVSLLFRAVRQSWDRTHV